MENNISLTPKKELLLRICLSVGALAALLLFIAFRVNTPGHYLIPVSVVAIIAGVFFEGLLISQDSLKFLKIFAVSFAASFVAFVPGKKEGHYVLNNHIQSWPYFLMGILAFIIITKYKNQVIRQLNEGVTLLQSAAILYWVGNYGLDFSSGFFRNIVIIFVLIFALYTIYHAFTYTPLSGRVRLTLSLWSSIIMLFFAVDHIYRVYHNKSIESSSLLPGYFIGLQYFLMGISLVYSLQNLVMLFDFLPGKHRFFNKEYFEDIKVLKQDHLGRFSDKQLRIRHAAYYLLFAYSVFGINYCLDLMPGHLAIWVVFTVFPYLVMLGNFIENKKTLQKQPYESL